MTTTMSGLHALMSDDGYAHIIKPGTAHECSLCEMILGDFDPQEETISSIRIVRYDTDALHDTRKTLRENLESRFGRISRLRVIPLKKGTSEPKPGYGRNLEAYVLKCEFHVISECKFWD